MGGLAATANDAGGLARGPRAQALPLPQEDCSAELPVKPLLAWWKHHASDRPWRNVRDPYALAMAQIFDTFGDAEKVGARWRQVIDRFPTARSLAEASESEIELALVRPLALRWTASAIRSFARHAVSEFGDVPVEERHLRRVMPSPRHGPRTVQLMATGEGPLPQHAGVVRVLDRLWGLQLPGEPSWQTGSAPRAVDRLGPVSKETFLALLDLAESTCTAERPACRECPLSAACRYAGAYSYP